MNDPRWPRWFQELSERYADRWDDTLDGSGYFHVDKPHANVWWSPRRHEWLLKSGQFESHGSNPHDLEALLRYRHKSWIETSLVLQ